MSRAVTEEEIDARRLAAILTPEDGVITEKALEDGRFSAVNGPMRSYQRTVAVEPIAAGGRVRVRQEVVWRLDIPYFRTLFDVLFRFEFRRLEPRDRGGRMPWWHPPERIDTRAAGVLAVLAMVAVVFGYLGTLFSQTLAFAAEEFHSSDAGQGFAASAVRVGGLLALLLAAAADRRGRRGIILVCLVAGCLAASTGALAPSLPWLAGSQTLARAFSSALVIVVGIVAVEDMPAGGRAYAISLITLAAGLGAGICIMALPIADLGVEGWRVLYVLPLLALPLTRGVARQLPETRRFAAQHAEVKMRGHGWRLALLGASGFLANLFFAPNSLFNNRYLRVERGYSGGGIALMSIVTGTPASLGVVFGGRLADARGRRIVGATSMVIGALLSLAFYAVSGWAMWVTSTLSGVVIGASVPALAVYGPELFPTSLRGRANGIIAITSLTGSAIGLSTAGVLADRFDHILPALAVLSIGPMLFATLIVTKYPETAHRELEDINPEDAPAATPLPPPL